VPATCLFTSATRASGAVHRAVRPVATVADGYDAAPPAMDGHGWPGVAGLAGRLGRARLSAGRVRLAGQEAPARQQDGESP
jgi:hypothetical protein